MSCARSGNGSKAINEGTTAGSGLCLSTMDANVWDAGIDSNGCLRPSDGIIYAARSEVFQIKSSREGYL